jgi:protein-tyrosine phosphatase
MYGHLPWFQSIGWTTVFSSKRSVVRMPRIVDFQSADEPRDVVHQIVQTLAEGKLVGLPTETGYVAAAHPLHPAGVDRLAALRTEMGLPRLVVVLKHPQESLDYVPQMGPLARKLTRRFWPGPVTLLFDVKMLRGEDPGSTAGDVASASESPTADSSGSGLAGALPGNVFREQLSADGLALRVPAHELLWSVLRLLPSPLVATGENHSGGVGFATASALADASLDALEFVVDAGPVRYELPTTLVRVGPDHWEVVSEGVATRRTLNRLAGEMYLFVCTGNTCRSPMAEGIFRKLLSEKLKCSEDDLVDRGFMVASAGVAAAPGSPASPEAVELLIDRGVDLRGHESQPATPQLLSQADQIFTMTRSHRDFLVREFPDLASRVRLLAHDGSDIIDPIGSGMEEYRRCAAQIEAELQHILTELPVS